MTNAKKGHLDKGFAFAGANAYRVNTITSVKELIETLITEYNNAAFNTKCPEESKQTESIFPSCDPGSGRWG